MTRALLCSSCTSSWRMLRCMQWINIACSSIDRNTQNVHKKEPKLNHIPISFRIGGVEEHPCDAIGRMLRCMLKINIACSSIDRNHKNVHTKEPKLSNVPISFRIGGVEEHPCDAIGVHRNSCHRLARDEAEGNAIFGESHPRGLPTECIWLRQIKMTPDGHKLLHLLLIQHGRCIVVHPARAVESVVLVALCKHYHVQLVACSWDSYGCGHCHWRRSIIITCTHGDPKRCKRQAA